MITITITASSMADAAAQMRAYIGDPAPGPVPSPTTPPAAAGRPVPDWAPPGASWVALPGAPALVDANGRPLAINWVNGKPLPVA